MHRSLRFAAASVIALSAACAKPGAKAPPAATAAARTEGGEAGPKPAATPNPAPAPAPLAQTPTAPELPEMPPYAAVVMHEVEDFEAWKAAFDAQLETRKQAGIVAEGVLRGVHDDELVVVYVPGSDAERLRALFTSPESAARMQRAGAKGKPNVLVFKDEGGRMAPVEKSGLYGAILRYEVAEFASFKAAMERRHEELASAGIVGWGLGLSLDDEREVFLYLQSDAAEKLEAYLSAETTRQAMQHAGARAEAQAVIVQESSMTLYR